MQLGDPLVTERSATRWLEGAGGKDRELARPLWQPGGILMVVGGGGGACPDA